RKVGSGLAFCLSRNESYTSAFIFLYKEGSDVEISYLQDKIAAYISVARNDNALELVALV
ncbi:unnamed protein product, partial [marine sediment metagenome]